MKIGIVGTGNMGRAIAGLLADGGHHVYVVGSEDAKAKALADELSGRGPGTVEAAATLRAAAQGCDMVLLATWFDVSSRIAVELSDVLRGKIVIDIANPFNATFDGLVTDHDSSAGEEIQRRLDGAKVVKAFNTTFAPVLGSSEFDGSQVDVFLASDHDDAKGRVAELISSTGLRPVDAGSLANSRVLERMALLMVELAGRYGLNFEAGVKVLPTRALAFPKQELVSA